MLITDREPVTERSRKEGRITYVVLSTGKAVLMTTKQAREVEAYRRRQREIEKREAEAKAAEVEAELRHGELDALLKASCLNPPRGFDTRMDVYAKTRTTVWILAYRGGSEYSDAVMAIKYMWQDKGKFLNALKLLSLH